MNSYRITKYNPKFRVNGIYTVNDWTSISDIGKRFENGILTYDLYIQTERSYIECCREIIQNANVDSFNIKCLEVYSECCWTKVRNLNVRETEEFIALCLREKCWGKIKSKTMFIHVSYDYYMYIGTELPFDKVSHISEKYGLYCEKYRSPYL